MYAYCLFNCRLSNDRGSLLESATRLQYNLCQAPMNYRVRLIRFFNDLLKSVMGYNIEPIDRCYSCAFAVRESESTANGLFYENPCIGRSKRDYRIEVSNVPAFFKHVYVNNDFSRLCCALNREKPLYHLFFLGAGPAGVNLNN